MQAVHNTLGHLDQLQNDYLALYERALEVYSGQLTPYPTRGRHTPQFNEPSTATFKNAYLGEENNQSFVK